MEDDSNLIPLSALQHYLFCKRQCAFIHVERLWFENRYTEEGNILHDRVDREDSTGGGKKRVEYSLHLSSQKLFLIGKADVVEFHQISNSGGNIWLPYPVEYKRGKPKKDNCDKVQLCAQAMCLEEMYEVEIPEGALFYGKTRRRQKVIFDFSLRLETEQTAFALQQLIAKRETPEPEYGKKCESCSFVDFCMPRVCRGKNVKEYLKNMLE